MRLLIVDDDENINRMERTFLTSKGYVTEAAYSGTEAVMLLKMNRYDLVVLDLMLPGMSGEEVLEFICKEYPATPVIALSAKDDIGSKLGMLKGGAQDYLTKPFDPEELLARIEIVLRRNQGAMAQARTLNFGNLELHVDSMELFQLGQPVALTKNEFFILEMLMERPSVVFTKDMIYEKLWNERPDESDNSINVHVSNLRKKLAVLEPDITYVKTVWGIGFKMNL